MEKNIMFVEANNECVIICMSNCVSNLYVKWFLNLYKRANNELVAEFL